MGMDVYGESPDNKRGEYFRNNIWYWPELWTLVTNICDDILTQEQIVEGFTNSGTTIDLEQSLAIAETLFTLIASNDRDKEVLKAVAETHGTEMRDNLQEVFQKLQLSESEIDLTHDEPDFCWVNATEFALFCKHSGGFQIW